MKVRILESIIVLGVALVSSVAYCYDGGGRNNAYVEQLQPRDSILIADQIEYGVKLPAVPENAQLMLPQIGQTLMPSVDVVESWKIDTLSTDEENNVRDLKAFMVVTSFDGGEYLLPDLPVCVVGENSADTLVFAGQDVLFCTMPVDTATFQINDIKGQMGYPMTFKELVSWTTEIKWYLLALAVAVILFFVARYFIKRHIRKIEEAARREPPHIVALRKLDTYRGDAYWAASKQKAFYCGVTDALREYINARYGINAMEMTTAEIVRSLKTTPVPEDLREDLEKLLKLSDKVKFAKEVAEDEENAEVVPFGVRFVTATYQEEIKEENNVL